VQCQPHTNARRALTRAAARPQGLCVVQLRATAQRDAMHERHSCVASRMVIGGSMDKACAQWHRRGAAHALTPPAARHVLPPTDEAAQCRAMSAPKREIAAAVLVLCRRQCKRSRVHAAAAALRHSATAASCYHAPAEAAICRRVLRPSAAQ
jgi:hypothetical protein